MTPSLLLLLLLSSLFFSPSFSQPHIALPLHRLLPTTTATSSSSTPTLAALASASLLRALHLKNPHPSSPSPYDSSLTTAPLVPHSYGGYSLSLSFGTPPQPIPLVLDTGSDLVWLPCTRSYLCKNCSFPGPSSSSSSPAPVFLPKSSTSSKLIGCRNPKCRWIHAPKALSRCQQDCASNSTDCSQICPPYVIIYSSGSTGGVLLSESLDLPDKIVPDFAVGCSVFSSRQPPAGIAGFGRGPASIPSQLGLQRFSYCLISRSYDDAPGEAGSVVLGGEKESSSASNVSFTPLLKNAAAEPGTPFAVYYYVGLRRITVGGTKVKVPKGLLSPDASGDGGTIVDSGSTFTFMEPRVFDQVARAFEEAVAGTYNRSRKAEEETGLRPCFSVPNKEANVKLPALVLHFKGGAELRLPAENYFAVVGESGEVCLTMVTDGGGERSSGPAVILGAFQQQNYRVVFDLERGRLGFKRQQCRGT